jgi:2-polyprenyl-3-methyl-5-hydroxy-6-metoxy-1,4-benzoquinol methylase
MDKWEMTLDIKSAKKSPIRKCFVRHPDTFESVEAMNAWLGRSGLHYIVDLKGVHSVVPPSKEFRRPRVTSVTPLSLEQFRSGPLCIKCEDDSVLTRVTKMRMLDLFCGAGGLSKGLVESGVCDPKYAIDHDSAALETYKWVLWCEASTY